MANKWIQLAKQKVAEVKKEGKKGVSIMKEAIKRAKAEYKKEKGEPEKKEKEDNQEK